MSAEQTQIVNTLHRGDCRDVLRTLPDAYVDLIVTSPPYADSRKDTYGGVHPNDYVDWFLPVGAELRRVLKDEGSFVLNIKEKAVYTAKSSRRLTKRPAGKTRISRRLTPLKSTK
jgi:DNA modification methylase